ncbi:MAG: nucleotidyltransferase family protein [Holophaga sp.]|nr:nucleotidyltransferase family protein [Holophaga sp.]
MIAQLQSRKESLVAMGVGELYLFGSVARDEARDDSDVDLLVEFTGPPSFDRFMDLKFFLEDALGIPVDLVTRRALKRILRTEIEREAVRVA